MKAIVCCYGNKGLIGHKGRMPHHLPDDLRYFKQMTSGGTVIMGRKTFASLPDKYRPLPNRMNIVLSRSNYKDREAAGLFFAGSKEKARRLTQQYTKKPVFVIGGAEVYHLFMPEIDEIYLTEVHANDVTGDTYFPAYENLHEEKGWTKHVIQHLPHAKPFPLTFWHYRLH